ncbi:30S ribosomal protein S6 [Ruminococcaceae bacterium OttesenSCG-928-A11]|nr:30S ribosomal protein S6 [Ruminococcaceae bacterium OttesenSCG-928-A11]
MKEYELVVLYHPDLEVDMKPATDKVAKIIEGAKGKIVSEDNWGRRKLTYPIRKETHAVYRIYTLELPSEAPKVINDTLNITNEVLRFLLTKVDPKSKLVSEKEKVSKEEATKEEE